MNREVSSYLDCARLLAACLVLMAHVQLNWVPGIWRFFVPLGNESLAALFVISGFVIGYVSDKRETALKTYLIHRAARVYSILIPCVAIGLLLDYTGEHFMAHYYHVDSWPPLGSKLQELASSLYSLTFLGGAWYVGWFPGSMAPYWTFPFEITCYLLFGFAWYLRGWRRLVALAVVVGVAGPPLLLFFPLWLCGMAMYRLHHILKFSIATGRWIFFTALVLILGIEALAAYFRLSFGMGVQDQSTLWPYAVTAALFCALTIGFAFSGFVISPYTRWCRWLAGASATLYLLHFPLGRFINGLVPYSWNPLLRLVAIMLPLVAATLMVAEFSERRKEAWRHKIEAGCEWVEEFFRQRKKIVKV